MHRPFAFIWILGLAACPRVTVEDDTDPCITWDTPERSVPEGTPADASLCVAGPRDVELPYGNRVVPDGAPWTLVEICTGLGDDPRCAPSSAVDNIATCVDSRKGDGCDSDTWGGRCTRRSLWSLCGPEQSVEGGCCYEAVVVEETWIE